MNRAAAVSAGVWSMIDVVFRQVVQFATTIVLARVLYPADFGVIALVLFFSAFAAVFVQSGLSEALVQRRTTTLDEESSVFWWNVIASVGFSGALVGLGPFLAVAYGAPILSTLVIAAAVQIVAAALGAVQTALFTRALRFDKLAKAGLISSVTSGAAAIVAALSGAGVWALGIQIASAAVINTAVLWLLSDWRPLRRFRLATIRNLLGFGLWLGMSTALEILYTQGFALLLGKLYGLKQLGLYNRAAGTQQLPANIFSAVIARVAFPLFSLRNDDPDAMRAGLRRANRIAMMINVPTMVGLALLPDLVIETLFGTRWLAATPILAILAWTGVVFPLHVLNLQVLLSLGQTRTYFRVEIIKKIVGIVAIAIGSLFGVFGLAYAQLGAAVIALFVNIAPVQNNLGYGVGAQFRDLGGVFAAAAAMAGAVLALRAAVALPPAPELALLAVSGALVYLLTGLMLPGRQFGDLLLLGRDLLHRRSAG